MDELEDYLDLNAEELADEIAGIDKEIEDCQSALARIRKSLNRKMELREMLIDRHKQLSQRKGWTK
jgi:hypothetical protein